MSMISVSNRPPQVPAVNPIFEALANGDEAAMLALQKQEEDIPGWIPEFLKNAEFLFSCLFKPQFSPASIYFSTAVLRRMTWGIIDHKRQFLKDKLIDRLKPIVDKALSVYKNQPPIYLEFFMIKVFFEEKGGRFVNYGNCFKRIEECAAKWIHPVPDEPLIDYLCDEASELVAKKFPFPQKRSLEEPTLPPSKKSRTEKPLTPYLIAVDTNPQVEENWLRLANQLPEGGSVELLDGNIISREEIFSKYIKSKLDSHK